MVHWQALSWGGDGMNPVFMLLAFGAPRALLNCTIYITNSLGSFDVGKISLDYSYQI